MWWSRSSAAATSLAAQTGTAVLARALPASASFSQLGGVLIGGQDLHAAAAPLAKQSRRVIARRNDRSRDLDNGMRATITHADEHGLTVRIDTGQARELDVEYAARHLEHAYCLTGHGMQGGTVQ